MNESSSSIQGFGWGCGITLGVLFALFLAFVMTFGGYLVITEMGKNASKTFNTPTKGIR